MIKKFLLLAALVLPMFAFAQELKIGIVDIEEIVQKHPDYADSQAKYVESAKQYEDTYMNLQEEMKRLYDEYNALGEDTPQTIRERKAKNLQEQQVKIGQFEQTIEQDLARVQQELLAPIYQKVQNAIQSIGQEEGFSLIQPKMNQFILYYASPVQDITPQVKAKLGIN
ncbi:MAG: OmpH family outer membrane protein [Muribaculaceae bacterium]|nr:OmpH family outer membrane protein [Muribaculaceae bacterium]